MKDNQNTAHSQQSDYSSGSQPENEKTNYTGSDKEVETGDQRKSDLQNTDVDGEGTSGDLAGNASGNEDVEDQ